MMGAKRKSRRGGTTTITSVFRALCCCPDLLLPDGRPEQRRVEVRTECRKRLEVEGRHKGKTTRETFSKPFRKALSHLVQINARLLTLENAFCIV